MISDNESGAVDNYSSEEIAPPKSGGDSSRDATGFNYPEAEIVIGLVGAAGTDLPRVAEIILKQFGHYRYQAEVVRISEDVILSLTDQPIGEAAETPMSGYDRIFRLQNYGNALRQESRNNEILAYGVAVHIGRLRQVGQGTEPIPRPRTAYIVRSLKHPDEMRVLREIYAGGFFSIGVFVEEERRREYLIRESKMTEEQARTIIRRDEAEKEKSGQQTIDTFHLCDFFVHYDGSNEMRMKNELRRILDLIFGKPFITPTFDEYAMYLAFASALRSADLSRQVGAVIAVGKDIISTGANDIPCAGGGLYWPDYDETAHDVVDSEKGRDYLRGEDSNVIERDKIIEEILDALGVSEEAREKARAMLRSSRLGDITEYGRVVHAEMEAMLSCARRNVSTQDGTLYCTTFPCHNCAKHIIAAGIKRVVFIEPYPKSKALDFHDDSVFFGLPQRSPELVSFEPFVGVGPRSYFSLFSMNWGAGKPIKRKERNGKAVRWESEDGAPRIQMAPNSYLNREQEAAGRLNLALQRIKDGRDDKK